LLTIAVQSSLSTFISVYLTSCVRFSFWKRFHYLAECFISSIQTYQTTYVSFILKLTSTFKHFNLSASVLRRFGPALFSVHITLVTLVACDCGTFLPLTFLDPPARWPFHSFVPANHLTFLKIARYLQCQGRRLRSKPINNLVLPPLALLTRHQLESQLYNICTPHLFLASL
jgi:hypothetical protein